MWDARKIAPGARVMRARCKKTETKMPPGAPAAPRSRLNPAGAAPRPPASPPWAAPVAVAGGRGLRGRIWGSSSRGGQLPSSRGRTGAGAPGQQTRYYLTGPNWCVCYTPSLTLTPLNSGEWRGGQMEAIERKSSIFNMSKS